MPTNSLSIKGKAGDPYDTIYCSAGGLSLRDYFASAAMQAEINGWYSDPNCTTSPADDKHIGGISERAYKHADALLAERAKGRTP